MGYRSWFSRKKDIGMLIGLGGVNPNELHYARKWGMFFSYTVLLVAIGLLLQWQLDLLSEIDIKQEHWVNWSIWTFFVFEYFILYNVVKKKWRFLRENWLLPIIILLGIPVVLNIAGVFTILRTYRPLLALVIMLPSLKLLISFFLDGQLRTTLFAALIIIIIFGVLVAGIDPNIKNAWDGIWWALATVSTVGYGDVVPTSPLGRLVGFALVALGLGIFVVITANFLGVILAKETKKIKEEEREVARIARDVQDLKEVQNETLQLLQSVNQKLKKLEEKNKLS